MGAKLSRYRGEMGRLAAARVVNFFFWTANCLGEEKPVCKLSEQRWLAISRLEYAPLSLHIRSILAPFLVGRGTTVVVVCSILVYSKCSQLQVDSGCLIYLPR